LGKVVRLPFPRSESNMKKTNLEIIQERSAQAQGIRTAVIEYNFDELPKHKEITKTSFFGVDARHEEGLTINTANLTYTM